MNFLSTFVTFENLHEVRRLCHWGPVIALSVIAICSTMAILDSIIWYWPLDTTGGSINFIMLINWTVLILYNYFNAMFVGPGYIPLGWRPVRTNPYYLFHLCLFRLCKGNFANIYCRMKPFNHWKVDQTFYFFVYPKTGESTGYPISTVLQSMPRVQGPQIPSLSQV